jgi:hypothetical protein
MVCREKYLCITTVTAMRCYRWMRVCEASAGIDTFVAVQRRLSNALLHSRACAV